jgi:hypothetical protein
METETQAKRPMALSLTQAAATPRHFIFPPLAGCFGFGSGYLVDGAQGILRYPERDDVQLGSGVQGIWMPLAPRRNRER